MIVFLFTKWLPLPVVTAYYQLFNYHYMYNTHIYISLTGTNGHKNHENHHIQRSTCIRILSHFVKRPIHVGQFLRFSHHLNGLRTLRRCPQVRLVIQEFEKKCHWCVSLAGNIDGVQLVYCSLSHDAQSSFSAPSLFYYDVTMLTSEYVIQVEKAV